MNGKQYPERLGAAPYGKCQNKEEGQVGKDTKPGGEDKEKLDFDDNSPVGNPDADDDEGFFGLPLE